jgi:c-di-GMP-binding flagellar brake protein YcgR
VEVTSKRGIVRFDVTVSDVDGRGVVRVSKRADGAHTLQRRDFVRVEAVVPVVVRDGGPDGPAHEAMTLNVSGGGLLLSGVSGLQDGDSAFVNIDLEDGSPPVEALVTVVRVAERGTRAVRIASVSARDEQRLVRFAFARERRARIARDA